MLMDSIGLGIVLPGAITLGLYVLAHRMYPSVQIIPAWTATVVSGIGFVTGQIGLSGLQGFLPAEASGWLVHLVLLTILVTLFTTKLSSKSRTTFSLGLLVGLAVPFLLLQPMWKHTWEPLMAALWIVSIGLVVLGLSTVQRHASSFFSPLSGSLMQCILALGTSLSLAGSGSLKLAQLAGVLTAVLGVRLFLDLVKPKPRGTPPGEIAISSTLLPALWLLGWFYSELPTASLALLALASVLPLLLRPGTKKIPGRPWQLLANAATALTPTTAAVLIALFSAPASYPY